MRDKREKCCRKREIKGERERERDRERGGERGWVCKREREGERKRERHTGTSGTYQFEFFDGINTES